MNLQLIEEIIELRDNNLSFTEITEVTGIGRSTIILTLRFHSILENHYSSTLSSFQENINQLTSKISALNNQCSDKDSEIDRLKRLLHIDGNVNVVLSKSEYNNLEHGLEDLQTEVEMLNNELEGLNNMSFSEKLKWLFNAKEQ